MNKPIPFRVEVTSTEPLVVGQRVEGTSRGYHARSGRRAFASAWSGVYLGTQVSGHEEAEAEVVHLFGDGAINGIAQPHHAFPVAQYVGVAA